MCTRPGDPACRCLEHTPRGGVAGLCGKWDGVKRGVDWPCLLACYWARSLLEEPGWGQNMLLGLVGVSWGCRIKVPQAVWLKTTEISCVRVVRARSLNSRCQQGHGPPRPFSHLCRFWADLWVPWLAAASLPGSASAVTWPPPCVSGSRLPSSYKGTSHTG